MQQKLCFLVSYSLRRKCGHLLQKWALEYLVSLVKNRGSDL